jgi:transcriptional regulator with XRE-family HTH domain
MPAKATLNVHDIRTRLGVSRKVFSRLIGFSERSIADWEAGKSLAPGSQARMREVVRLHAALANVMDPSFVGAWLETPNEAFDQLKPLEVIERGETDRIWRMIFFLESGVPS